MRRLAVLCLIAGGASLCAGNAVCADRPAFEDWSDTTPPAGWSREAYAPDRATPAFGADLDPAGIGPDGRYDPYFDPRHPLKDPAHDPGEAWDRTPQGGARDGSPGVQAARADWEWGERYFDDRFDVTLIVTNRCNSPQPVRIFVHDLPYLSLPAAITVPPGETRVTGRVVLPPEPPPPLRLGLPGEPGWGHVQFPPFIPVGFPPPKLHQPNFTPIAGSVVTWHPWAPADGGVCLPERQTYVVSGHIHFRPPPPSAGSGGPEKIAAPSLCQVYWNIGVPPAQYAGEDCTAEMRTLAKAYRERVLDTYALNAPEDWGWLPSLTDLDGFDVPRLLDMKAQADRLVGLR